MAKVNQEYETIATIQAIAKPVGDVGGFVKAKNAKKIGELKFSFDGEMLDVVCISAVLTTQQDFDDLIEVLRVHKNCLYRHGNKEKKQG